MQHHRKKKATSRSWALRSSRQIRSQRSRTSSTLSPNSAISPIFEEDVCVKVQRQWTPALGIRLALKAVGSLCQGWKSTFAQACAGFLSAVLSWREQTRQMDVLRQQVAELQGEMNLLRCALQANSRTTSLCCCQKLSCNSQVQLSAPLANDCGSTVDPLPVFTPVVPPLPPPPPPPPPPPAIPQQRPLLIVKKRPASPTLQKEKGHLIAVTVRDLQTVKLRKITDPIGKLNVSPSKSRAPLVTVDDLQKVRLRRSTSDLPSKLHLSLGRTPKKSPMRLRSQLKKVQIERSPGGTPLFNKENKETGTGLTPIMTQALRRKFQNTMARSPSPKSNRSFDEHD
ncbi:proline-rich protein 11 isoform X2 [Scleropages formosus]|nr:proline-rich protein 11 isoform X2 [Scleropages formosus]